MNAKLLNRVYAVMYILITERLVTQERVGRAVVAGDEDVFDSKFSQAYQAQTIDSYGFTAGMRKSLNESWGCR